MTEGGTSIGVTVDVVVDPHLQGDVPVGGDQGADRGVEVAGAVPVVILLVPLPLAPPLARLVPVQGAAVEAAALAGADRLLQATRNTQNHQVNPSQRRQVKKRKQMLLKQQHLVSPLQPDKRRIKVLLLLPLLLQ